MAYDSLNLLPSFEKLSSNCFTRFANRGIIFIEHEAIIKDENHIIIELGTILISKMNKAKIYFISGQLVQVDKQVTSWLIDRLDNIIASVHFGRQ